MNAYIVFFDYSTPYCPVAKKFYRENPLVKDVRGLVGNKDFRRFYPVFVEEYGYFPYYGKVSGDLVIFLPFREKEENDKIIKDLEVVKKIAEKEKVKNFFVSTVYPLRFFYFYASNVGLVKNIYFVSSRGDRLKVVATITPNPFLCRGR